MPAEGLSPRGRGNRDGAHRRGSLRGSIPAWAGKPRGSSRATPARSVYPRVGGETPSRPDVDDSIAGLSPRGRGNHQQDAVRRLRRGSIPAWAGKPGPRGSAAGRGMVYPRVGGETRYCSAICLACLGLSPRGRGNRRGYHLRGRGRGSIPAWAGKPSSLCRAIYALSVYPRVGGETSRKGVYGWLGQGLSPRGRGNPRSGARRARCSRSIPAWAGKPSAGRGPGATWRVYPRVGGETPRLPER